jgi:hypothetical protein
MASTIISVDLDPPSCYRTIHGLAAASDEERSLEGLVLARALKRFLELFAQCDVRATFFAIGRSLESSADPDGHLRLALQEAISQGHEIANHSYAHRYDLAAASAREQGEDLQRADQILRTLGTKIQGFRAPGYTQSPSLLREVAALGYTYDSSALPSPTYFLAKRAVMAKMRLSGRRSGAFSGGIRSFLGPDRPHRLEGGGLWEVPISVTPNLRVPAVGTFLLAGPTPVRRALASFVAQSDFAHLEFHALDLVGTNESGVAEEIVRVDPSLAVDLETRQERAQALLRARGGGESLASIFAQLA